MSNRKGSKRELLTSDESTGCENSNNNSSESDEGFKRKKSKKTKPSKPFSDDEDLTVNKRSSRKVKETDFDRQLRLALEQSAREAKEAEAKRLKSNERVSNDLVDLAEASSAEEVIKIEEIQLPGAKTSDPKKSRQKLAEIQLDTSDEENKDSSEKPVDLKEKSDEVCPVSIVSDSNSNVALSKSNEKKPQQPRQKLAAIKLDTSDEENIKSGSNQGETDDLSPPPPATSSVAKNMSSEKKAKKPRKKLADFERSSNDSDSDEDAEFGSGKKKPTKKTSAKKKKETSGKKNLPKQVNKETSSEVTEVFISDSSTKRTLDMSEYQPDPTEVPAAVKNPHSLLPKHVSRLPPKSTAPLLANDSYVETKKHPVNTVFKSVANLANISSSSSGSPLGRIEIKNNSPCVRVGLSRNIKTQLHKNVKPCL